MKFKDLIKPIEEQTDEELRERLLQIRHNREVARPVAKRKAAKSAAKQSQKKLTSAEKLLAGLTDEEKEALIRKLIA